MKKEEARNTIAALVERFEEQYDSYKRSDYSEALVRKDFVDPFFKALGWDMDNSQGYAEAYREVIHEDKVKVAKTLKAPDYSFKLSGGKRLFFVEAKKPHVRVKVEVDPAYQLRRYAWSAKLPISILTDFEEFSVYDCTKRPNPTDSAAVGRIKYMTFREYLSDFDYLWETFSKEHVLKGSFDKYVKSDKGKRGTATVDNAFLESLDTWRTYLATSIAKNNPKLTEDELNFTVQHAIDRIIFLRIAEDRGVEPYGQLNAAMKEGGDLYRNLFGLFKHADDKYNSGLFDFKKDRVSEKLTIDNKVVRSIVEELYYPKSPYEFSVLSVEILGSAYEQFLGKRIRMDSGHRARIEEKPEVRKAGGVYYTPQYIVDYIVHHTVGELVKGKAPKDVAELRIVDPACGSGSFLLGAFQFLLDWHRNYYSTQAKPNRGKKDEVLRPDGQLTTNEKKRILLNNIYGVDLDANAVEVTKLSLLLKCMEGETEASINQQVRLFHDRVLPTLDENIKCGNSLIAPDIYDGMLSFESETSIKPFDWNAEFKKLRPLRKADDRIFDVVIGNPPYVQQAMYEWFDNTQRDYLLSHYSSSMGRMNTFGFFIEKGVRLLTAGGRLGFIVPNTVLTQEYYKPLRKYILDHARVNEIVTYEKPPFADAVVEAVTLLVEGSQSRKYNVRITNVNKEQRLTTSTLPIAEYHNDPQLQFSVVSDTEGRGLRKVIDGRSAGRLGEICSINQAIALKGDRAAHLFDKPKGKSFKPVLDGREVNRYRIDWAGNYLRYDLEAIHSCKREDIFLSRKKIFFRRVSSSLIATIDERQFYALNTLVAINLNPDADRELELILGLFNSKLWNFYYTTFLKSTKKVFSEIQARSVAQLPLPRPNKALDTEIVRLVRMLLDLMPQVEKKNVPEQVKRRIAHTEDKINEAVYALYSLNKQEVEMVEAGVRTNEA